MKTPVRYVEVQGKDGLIGYEVRDENETVICEIKPRPYRVLVSEKSAASIVESINNFKEFSDIVKSLATFDGCYGGGEPMDFTDYRLNVKTLVDRAEKAINDIHLERTSRV